jgi:hypothetical protein
VELGQCDEKSSRIHPLVSSVSQSVNIAVDYIPTSSQNPRQITAINDDVCKPSSQYVDSQLHRDRNVNNRHNRQVIQQSRAGDVLVANTILLFRTFHSGTINRISVVYRDAEGVLMLQWNYVCHLTCQ